MVERSQTWKIVARMKSQLRDFGRRNVTRDSVELFACEHDRIQVPQTVQVIESLKDEIFRETGHGVCHGGGTKRE